MSLASAQALGSGLSLQEAQRQEVQAELQLLQCWGEGALGMGMELDVANKRHEMEDAEDQEKERDTKWARPESKGGFGRGGRGKGNQQGQPKNPGPRRQPIRRSTEADTRAPEGMMWLLGKLLLRHEDQMGIDRTQNGFVMFFKKESALSLVLLFVQKSQHWHALKEQKQEKMDEIAMPLRSFLLHTMLETLVKRIKDTVKNEEQLKTATTLQVFLPKEGDLELRIPFLSYNPETKALVPRQDQEPIYVSKMLEKLQLLQKQCLCPLAIMRFHSTQRLNGPLQGPTVPFLLQVGFRSPEAAELYLSPPITGQLSNLAAGGRLLAPREDGPLSPCSRARPSPAGVLHSDCLYVQTPALLRITNSSNHCYANSVLCCLHWANQLICSCMARPQVIWSEAMHSVVRRMVTQAPAPDLWSSLQWSLLHTSWTRPHSQHDVAEYLVFCRRFVIPDLLMGRWQNRLLIADDNHPRCQVRDCGDAWPMIKQLLVSLPCQVKAELVIGLLGSKMNVAQVLGSFSQGLSFVLQGSSTNWWGLACPAHCAGSVTLLILALITGTCAGFVLALWIFRSALFAPSIHPLFDLPGTSDPDAVDSLRLAIEELEEGSDNWEVVDDGPASSSSFPGPRVGDPLPGAGLQAGAVLRGDQRVRVFTTFGKFKHFTGPLEGSGGLTLDWPAVPPRSCVFVPLVARQGGILAAVAADLAEEQEDGSLAPTGPVEVASFDPASPHLQLHHPAALQLARTWIASEEGPAPSEAPKRRPAPKPKRQTNAQLADQLNSLVEMLPTLTRQVQEEDLGELGLDEATGVGQQALRRLAPSEPAPQSREDLVSRRPLFTLYAERFGGFGSQRGLGRMFWLVCNILDAMVAGDHTGAEEMAALAAIAIEQAAQDAGSWDVAYLLTLMEDPPHQLFAHRPQSQNPRLRAFGGLTPQPWATTTLSYIREIDTIQSRRTEATSSKAKAGAQDTETPAKPKRSLPRRLLGLTLLFFLGRGSRVAARRVAHVAVMACNFLFAGASPVPLRLLTHRPNKAQASAIAYVYKLCRACGAVEPFVVGSAGRRNLNLLSSLGQLCDALTVAGPSGDPYGPLFHGVAPSQLSEVLQDTPACGDGQWDPVPFLGTDPDLQMACLEPDLLLTSLTPKPEEVPDLTREDPQEALLLALKWADKDLLYLKEDYGDQVSEFDAVRVFNCSKNSECDRQIGDRRARNFRERRLRGPSVSLPCGPVLLGMYANPATTTARIAIADRKDFYHQLGVGPRKARHNALYPALPSEALVGTVAFADLVSRRCAPSKRASLLCAPRDCGKVVACFQAIFQGDHLGVEIATCAHRNLLKENGLLGGTEELLATQVFPEGSVFQGLVIDDFYCVSLESPGLPPESSAAVLRLDQALGIYAKDSLLGSSEKDVRGADCAKIAGAELDASVGTRRAGMILAGSPRSKRLSLASISLSLASLPATSPELQSCLLGGWVSAFIYRRPLMAVFAKSFGLGSSSRDAALDSASDLVDHMHEDRLQAGELSHDGRVEEEAYEPQGRGWVVGPILHFDFSPHYDVKGLEFYRWLLHLLKFRSLMLAPSLACSVTQGTGQLFLSMAGLPLCLVSPVPLRMFSRGASAEGFSNSIASTLRPLVNDLALGLEWQKVSAWHWTKASHINCLETEAYLRLCQKKVSIHCPDEDSPEGLSNLFRPSLLSSTESGLIAALPRLGRWASNWDRYAKMPSLTYVPPPFGLQLRLGRPLPSGRPVERVTQRNRDKLWAGFLSWASQQGIPEGLFDEGPFVDVDSINAVLAKFGRELYAAGRPYSHFSETVNALASRLPKVRRLLQPAWDVAFQWQRMEPHVHHQAMPWQILLALLASALCWGWLDVAGILALAWGGLARIGEVFAAKRGDLVLPEDTGESSGYILLSVKEPKTRNTAARHQALRLDQPQLVELVALAFRRMVPLHKLWPMSPSSFRSRFAKLVSVLQLDLLEGTGIKPLDLGSLRAGGATWLLQATEDGELASEAGERKSPSGSFFFPVNAKAGFELCGFWFSWAHLAGDLCNSALVPLFEEAELVIGLLGSKMPSRHARLPTAGDLCNSALVPLFEEVQNDVLFSTTANGAKDVTRVLPDPRILLPCFQHRPLPHDSALTVRYCEYQLIAVISHEGLNAASGHYRALLCTYPPDAEPTFWQCDDSKEPIIQSEMFSHTLTTGYLYFYCRTMQSTAGWDALTEQTRDSVACVFLCKPEDGLSLSAQILFPQQSAFVASSKDWALGPLFVGGFGRHCPDPDNETFCLCYKIYGQSKPWGCYWYKRWKENVQRAVEQKQRLKAVFFAGQVGMGKVDMADLPMVDLWNGIGLGGSQKAELATADEEGWQYDEVDVSTLLEAAFPKGAEVDAWCDDAKSWRRGRIEKFRKDLSKDGQKQVCWTVRCETGDAIDTYHVMDAVMSMRRVLDCLGPRLSCLSVSISAVAIYQVHPRTTATRSQLPPTTTSTRVR
ncbi:unnamed protein product [Symbiodinium sp. CCMP2592]|nr:unnamed protein product [Symbiodinium sp. CCMP2592]